MKSCLDKFSASTQETRITRGNVDSGKWFGGWAFPRGCLLPAAFAVQTMVRPVSSSTETVLHKGLNPCRPTKTEIDAGVLDILGIRIQIEIVRLMVWD